MNVLYVVATPIGNLRDITFRAVEVLKEVDLILAEDTRVTKRLLEHYGIKTTTISYHQHSRLKKIDYVLGLLKQGGKLALVSDAGTPGISDPGGKLVSQLVSLSVSQGRDSKTGKLITDKLKIVAIPGLSALTAAASISGFPMDRFLFLGFPPTKRKRKKFFEEIINSKHPVIFYESPYRIIKTLKELEIEAKSCKLEPKIVVCREMTKKFETIYRGKAEEIIKILESDKNNLKGEFVIIVENKNKV